MPYSTITKENIRIMVDRFYSAILHDDVVADFFIEKLGDEMITDEWQDHLRKLTDFWATTLLGEAGYKGQPIKPHLHMQGLQRVAFERWLQIFNATVQRLYEKEAAETFQQKGEVIANNFMKVLQL